MSSFFNSSKKNTDPPKDAAEHQFMPVSVTLPGKNDNLKNLPIVDNKGNMVQAKNLDINNPGASKDQI